MDPLPNDRSANNVSVRPNTIGGKLASGETTLLTFASWGRQRDLTSDLRLALTGPRDVCLSGQPPVGRQLVDGTG
jgi:hypothetical protein